MQQCHNQKMTITLGQERARLEAKLQFYRQNHRKVPDPDPQEIEEKELKCREASSTGKHANVSISPAAAVPPTLTELKNTARGHLQAGDASAAIEGYTAAISAAQEQQLDYHGQAALYSNLALANITAGRLSQVWLWCTREGTRAVQDAEQAAGLAPAWPKPLHRLAQALAGLQRWPAAVAACRKGAAFLGQPSHVYQGFAALLDTIAVDAALQGDLSGFDGRRLEVRDAGEEAWLGREAPHDPELDADPEEEPPLLLMPTPAAPSVSSYEGHAGAISNETTDGSAERAMLPVKRGLSFRSLHAAMEAARDGDIITLKKGIHNGLGETVHVAKRVLIRGEGALGEARYDMRANSPALRLGRSCVLARLDIDMTGFREALLVEGPPAAKPAVLDCLIRCSGDDAVNVCGKAAPRFVRCRLQARKCGLRAYDAPHASLADCRVEECGEQGVKAFDASVLTLCRCHVCACEEDGIVGMDRAVLRLDACTITGCKGPAVDLTGSAKLAATDCAFTGCVGAVWMWDKSAAAVKESRLQADQTYVLLIDQEGRGDITGCNIDGKAYASNKAQLAVWLECNATVEPDKHIGTPVEEGAFEFVPDRFTRKQ